MSITTSRQVGHPEEDTKRLIKYKPVTERASSPELTEEDLDAHIFTSGDVIAGFLDAEEPLEPYCFWTREVKKAPSSETIRRVAAWVAGLPPPPKEIFEDTSHARALERKIKAKQEQEEADKRLARLNGPEKNPFDMSNEFED